MKYLQAVFRADFVLTATSSENRSLLWKSSKRMSQFLVQDNTASVFKVLCLDFLSVIWGSWWIKTVGNTSDTEIMGSPAIQMLS